MTKSRETLHPGRILLSQAMEPLGISRNQLARDIDVPVGRISDITNGKRGVTADTALRLGRYFGTGPELWLRLQAEFDLHVARMTTWPAVESRVRVLNPDAPVAAPMQDVSDALPTQDVPDAAQIAAAVSTAPDEVPPVEEPIVETDGVETDGFAQTEAEPLTDLPVEALESESYAEDDQGTTTAQLVDRPEIFRDRESSRAESRDDEEQFGLPPRTGPGDPVADYPVTGDTDFGSVTDARPTTDPYPVDDPDEDLGIPPIPDQSKLYQSG